MFIHYKVHPHLEKYIYDVNANFIKITFLNFKNILKDKTKSKIYIKTMFGITKNNVFSRQIGIVVHHVIMDNSAFSTQSCRSCSDITKNECVKGPSCI